MLEARTVKNKKTIIGSKRSGDAKPYRMKRSRLRRFSKKAKENHPAYLAVREFTENAHEKVNGSMDGTERFEVVPCACGCGTRRRIAEMHPHHIDTRHGNEPGELNYLWRPTNIAWITKECHREIHDGKRTVDRFIITQEAQSLEVAIVLWLNRTYPLAGKMKWSDEMQSEAIFAVLKLDELKTCGCGEECMDEGEEPEEDAL